MELHKIYPFKRPEPVSFWEKYTNLFECFSEKSCQINVFLNKFTE